MRSFLITADEEQSQNKVLATRVKQIGVLAYKVEDSLMDFGLHSEKKPFLGCIPRNPGDRRRIAKEVKQLRTEVEDTPKSLRGTRCTYRNLRYRLIKETSGSKPTVTEEQASTATTAMFIALVTSNDVNLRVISMWGTSGDLGKTSAIQEVYDDPKVLKRFRFLAWIRLMHPFNPQEFLQRLVRQFYENSRDEIGKPSFNPQEFLRSLVRQFYGNSHDEVGKPEQETSVGAVLAKMEKMDQSDLVPVFNAQLCSNSYVVVIDDLSTIVEWHCIKKYFPDNKKQSRIVVSTQLAEIGSLCTENPYQVSEFNQLSCDQTIYLFHKKNSEKQVTMGNVSVVTFDTNAEVTLAAVEKEKRKAMHESCFAEPISISNNVTTTEKNTTMLTTEVEEEDQEPNIGSEVKVHNSTARKKLDRSRTLALADEVICGRET
ncbi:hypothetical protein VPH35_114606 [Triticum aestivum]